MLCPLALSQPLHNWIQRVENEVAELRRAVASHPPDPQTNPGPGLGMWTSGFNMGGRQLQALAEARLALLKGEGADAIELLRKVSGQLFGQELLRPIWFLSLGR